MSGPENEETASDGRVQTIAALRDLRMDITEIARQAQRVTDRQTREDLVARANQMTAHLLQLMRMLNLTQDEITQILRD